MNIEDRPTPETDSKQVHASDALREYINGKAKWRIVVPLDFARQLERQNAALWEALEKAVARQGFSNEELIEARATLAATKPNR